MKERPTCRSCYFMRVTGYAKVTGNNSHLKGPRGDCMCVHPDAFETFNRVCQRSSRLAAFIGYTPPGEKKAGDQDVAEVVPHAPGKPEGGKRP